MAEEEARKAATDNVDVVTAGANRTVEFKTGLQWFSSWRGGDKMPRSRVPEFADIGLVVCEGKNAILINGKLDEGSSWAFRQTGSEDYFLALKMTTLTKPKHLRYYGFTTVQMTVGDKCYLCQHSTKAEANSEHTVDTYMTKFLAGDMKKEQTYHISLCHTSLVLT